MADPLFPEDLPSKTGQGQTASVPSLFPEEPTSSISGAPSPTAGANKAVTSPLFDEAGKDHQTQPLPSSKTTAPIFSDSAPVEPAPQSEAAASPIPRANPLFAPTPLAAPPPAKQEQPTAAPLSFPETAPASSPSAASLPFAAGPLTEPPAAPAKVEASPAFADTKDPLVEKAWDILLQLQPQATPSQKAHWHAVLSQLFPLTADRLATVGQAAVRHAPQVLQEISRETQTFTTLDVATKVQKIADEAKASPQRAKKGLGGLLSKVEGVIHPFDPQEAFATIISLSSALHGMSGRSRPIRDLAQTVFEQIQDDLPLLAALRQMSQGTPTETWVSRRQDLLLASAQQLQMALQQIENLENQNQSARASLDELRTITLPALGFLSAIQS